MSNDVEFHLISFEKKETFEANRERIASFCKSNSIQWFPQSYTKKPPILSTLKDLKRMKQLSMELNSTLNFDLIHARSYLPAMIASVLKKKLNVPFLFDMRGFWADERVEGKIWSLGNPVFKMIFRYMKGREKKLLMHADAVISLTEKGKILLNDIAQDEQIIEKTKVIPCCVDTQRFDPSLFPENLKREIKKELEIEESSFVLGYVGSIGTWYMLDEMLLFFKTLLIQKHEATFLFVTKESTDFLIKRARFYGIDPFRIS